MTCPASRNAATCLATAALLTPSKEDKVSPDFQSSRGAVRNKSSTRSRVEFAVKTDFFSVVERMGPLTGTVCFKL